MQRKPDSFVLVCILISLSVLFQACRSTQIPSSAYINNDSTAIYSTHISRPFRYGFAYSKEQCLLYFGEALKNYGIKNGDVVADVGAASGWVAGALSVMTDSVHFYVQDIDTNFLNRNQLDAVIKHYSSQRITVQTNVFYLITGTAKKTGLPEATFTKIIINNAFHEMGNPYIILNDLYTKLKPGGKIIIYDEFSNAYKTIRHTGCHIRALKAKTIINIASMCGYYLTNMAYPENSFCNYLTFEKDRSGYDAFIKAKNPVNVYINELDKLNQASVYLDSAATTAIAHFLKDHMSEIAVVYPSLETYLNSLGFQLCEQKQFMGAINILKINTFLYPASSLAYDNLGDALMKSGQYTSAAFSFKKAVELNPGNKNAQEQINKITLKTSKPN